VATRRASALPAHVGKRTVLPKPVVLFPLLGIGQHGVRFRDLLEARLGGLVAGIGIGMVLLGELAIGLLDFVGRRRLGHAEGAVVILVLGHRLVHDLGRRSA